jgi:hypothetical protein
MSAAETLDKSRTCAISGPLFAAKTGVIIHALELALQMTYSND